MTGQAGGWGDGRGCGSGGLIGGGAWILTGNRSRGGWRRGLLVWLFARNALHIGASGWIFGLWSLCIATAWYDRKFINILIALLVVFLYGGMLFGVLPNDPRISFESHFFGAIAGVVCAFFQARLFNNKM